MHAGCNRERLGSARALPSRKRWIDAYGSGVNGSFGWCRFVDLEMSVSHDALLLVERSRDGRHRQRDADRSLDHTRIERRLAADDGGVELVPVLYSENRPGVDGGLLQPAKPSLRPGAVTRRAVARARDREGSRAG